MDRSNIPWNKLDRASRVALIEDGYKVSRARGHSGANIWVLAKGDEERLASIRTTKDRWFAYVPQQDGRKFKTLDDVDLVVVASVDDPKDPKAIEVFLFPAEEVRKRFTAAYNARKAAEHALPADRGMWLALDYREGNSPSNVGSGIADKFPAIASLPLDLSDVQLRRRDTGSASQVTAVETTTIADVIAEARRQISAIAGVPSDAVRIDLKIEY